jgi:hypothetical protein
MYNGISISYLSGSSGDFFANFINVCYDKNSEELLKLDYNFDISNKYYDEFLQHVWYKLNFTQKYIFIKTYYPGTTAIFRPRKNFYSERYIRKTNWKDIIYNLDEMKLAFNKKSNSVASFHYAQPSENYENYFDMVDKLVNHCNIKLYHIDCTSKYSILYAFYVITTSQMAITQKTESDMILYQKWQKYIATKDKEGINTQIEKRLEHERWLIEQYKERNIDFELIDLEYYLKTRDFDHLHNLISKSYPLKTIFSKKNKELVNNEWNNRLDRMNRLGLFDLI